MLRFLRILLCLSIGLTVESVHVSGQCSVHIIAGNGFLTNYLAGCTGSPNTNLSSTISAGYAYQWQMKTSPTATYSNITGATGYNHLPATSGYYRVMISNTSCTAYSDSIEVNISSTLPLSVTPTAAALCGGSGVRLSLPGIAGTYYFSWYRNSSIVTSDTTVYAAISGSYYCVVTDPTYSGCSGTSPTATVTVTTPAAPIVGSPLLLCQGSSTGPLSASGSNLLWFTVPTGGTGSVTAPTPVLTSPGTFNFWVSQMIAGCTSPRAQIVVNVTPPDPPPVVIGTMPFPYCQGVPATPLNVVGGLPGAILFWYDTGRGGPLLSSPPTPVTVNAGNDTFWVSELKVCESNRIPVYYTVYPTPSKPTASASTRVCPGDTIFFGASSILTSQHYSWTGPGSFTDTTKNPFIPNASPTDSGLYKLRIVANGCSSPADSVHVQVSCPDSVWAGDVSYDKIVDNLDALQIALCFGYTGPARSASSIAWQAAYCNKWTGTQPGYPLINRKHADCDGDGIVGYSDTLAVTANYGLVHLKNIPHAPAAKITGQPNLRFDLSGVNPIEGQTVNIPVLLGGTVGMDSLAGIALRIKIDGIVPATLPSMSYPISWLGNAGNTLRFTKNVGSNQLDWAYARVDHHDLSGSGILATLSFTIPFGSAGQDLKLHFDDVTLVDAGGRKRTAYNILEDSLTIRATTGIGSINQAQPHWLITPNPSSGNSVVQLQLPAAGNFRVELRELSGRRVWQLSGTGKKGRQDISLPTAALSAGVYLVNLSVENQPGIQTLRFIKE